MFCICKDRGVNTDEGAQENSLDKYAGGAAGEELIPALIMPTIPETRLKAYYYRLRGVDGIGLTRNILRSLAVPVR
jgi:hypothetical protein